MTTRKKTKNQSNISGGRSVNSHIERVLCMFLILAAALLVLFFFPGTEKGVVVAMALIGVLASYLPKRRNSVLNKGGGE